MTDEGFGPVIARAVKRCNKDLFFKNLDKGQRLGQAWFDALSRDDQEILRATAVDPFFKNGWSSVSVALLFLEKYDLETKPVAETEKESN